VPSYAAELWWGLFVPAKTAPELIARLSGELRKALDPKDVRDKIAVEGAAPAALTPAEFQKVVNADIEQWRSVADRRRIKPD
jgi:tripartite-type tricarboxylate transporter receptor subunit TctC